MSAAEVRRPWIINASPLIVLGKINALSWLDLLGGTWRVPQAVVQEILSGPEDDPARCFVQSLDQTFICNVEVPSLVAAWDLGAGESAVIAWAYAHKSYEAILDDRAARVCAKALGLTFAGTLAVIVRAKRAQIISQVKPLLADLRIAGLRMDPQLEAAVIKQAGEQV